MDCYLVTMRLWDRNHRYFEKTQRYLAKSEEQARKAAHAEYYHGIDVDKGTLDTILEVKKVQK